MLDGPEKFTYISSLLSNEENERLQRVLLQNIEVFAWNNLDMNGIDPTLASHELNVIPPKKLVRQKAKSFYPDFHQII